MNMYKNINRAKVMYFFIYFIYNIYFWIVVGVLLFSLWQFYFQGILLCDSISSNASEGKENIHAIDPKSDDLIFEDFKHSPGVLLKSKNAIRRKLYWFFIGKSSDDFGSYEDFKKSWEPSWSLRNEFKVGFRNMIKNPIQDFEKTRHKASKDFASSLAKDKQWSEALKESKQLRGIQRLKTLRAYSKGK